MTIIILGSSGFLGKALISKLEAENLKYKGMVKQKNKSNKKYFLGDITRKNFLEKQISNNDVVVNLIGQDNKDISKLFEQNVNGALNLLNSVIKKKNIKIIFISTTMIYDQYNNNPSKENDILKPITNYQITKVLAENMYSTYSKIFGINITILRFSNVYGPNKKNGIISNCLKNINNNKPIRIDHNGNQIRDFLYIDDAVQAIIKTISNPPKGFNVLNISSGKGIKIKKIIKIIEHISKRKISIQLTSKGFGKKNLVADNAKAKKVLKFIPKIEIEEGLKQIFLKK